MGFNSGFKGLNVRWGGHKTAVTETPETAPLRHAVASQCAYERRRSRVHSMFVDPCIIVKFMKKNPTRCNNVSKFYYSVFIWSSTCFRRHTAHHQEPKTAPVASGFAYVEGCWTCSCQAVPDNVHQLHVQQPCTYEKPEAAGAVLGSWWWAVCRSKHVELHIK